MSVDANEGRSIRKRPNNCFTCWHCRRIDGMAGCCVCVAFMTKTNKPELIEEPYGGICDSYYDKSIVENDFMGMDQQ